VRLPKALLDAAPSAIVAAAVVRLRQDDGLQQFASAGQYLEHATRLTVWREWRDHDELGWLDRLQATDGSYPPVAHLAALLAEPILGADAAGVERIGILWLFVVGIAALGLLRAWGGRGRALGLAFGLTVLLPAVHATATRYGTELPMVALLYGSWALLASGHAILAAVVASLACLTKWTAVPFVLLAFAAEAWRSRRVGRPILAAVLGFALLLPWLDFGARMGSLGGAGAEMLAQLGDVDEAHDALWPASAMAMAGVGRLGFLLSGEGLRRATWVPLAFVTSLLGPAALLALVVPALSWRRRPAAQAEASARVPAESDSRGPAFPVGATLLFALGSITFLLLCIPVRDERFLLPLLPLLALHAALRLGPAPAWRALLVQVVLALVLLDFHRGPPAPWNHRILLRSDGPPPIVAVLRGLATSSSIDGRGWTRADERQDSRSSLREAAWAAILADDGVRSLAWVHDRPLIQGPGDEAWLRYESELLRWSTGRRLDVGVLGEGTLPDRLLIRADQLPPPRWSPRARVADPAGGVGLTIVGR
jgi:hypothetical protein